MMTFESTAIVTPAIASLIPSLSVGDEFEYSFSCEWREWRSPATSRDDGYVEIVDVCHPESNVGLADHVSPEIDGEIEEQVWIDFYSGYVDYVCDRDR